MMTFRYAVTTDLGRLVIMVQVNYSIALR